MNKYFSETDRETWSDLRNQFVFSNLNKYFSEKDKKKPYTI